MNKIYIKNSNIITKLARMIIYAGFVCILSSCTTKNNDNTNIATSTDFNTFCMQTYFNNYNQSIFDIYSHIDNPTSLGITTPNNIYPSLDIDINKKKQDISNLIKQLNNYNPASLNSDELILYNALYNKLNIDLTALDYYLFYEPLNATNNIVAQLNILLTSFNIYSKDDINSFILLLQNSNDFFSKIITHENNLIDNNRGLSKSSIQNLVDEISSYRLSPDGGLMYANIKTQINECSFLTESEKNNYLNDVHKLIVNNYNSALNQLISDLTKIKANARPDNGLAYMNAGSNYYKFLLYKSTGKYYNDIDKLLSNIDIQLKSNINKMAASYDSNYITESVNKKYSTIKTYKDIIKHIQNGAIKYFPTLDDYNFDNCLDDNNSIVIPNNISYLYSNYDNIFFIDKFNISKNKVYINSDILNITNAGIDTVKNIAANIFPGKLYYINYYKKYISKTYGKNNPIFRDIFSNSFLNGYKQYINNYTAYFNDNLKTDELKFLSNNNLNMFIYAYLDISIHYLDKDENFVKSYLSDFYSDIDDNTIHQVYLDILQSPTKYVSTYIGYNDILNMKQLFYKNLDENYSPNINAEITFHKLLMSYPPTYFKVLLPKFSSDLLNIRTTN